MSASHGEEVGTPVKGGPLAGLKVVDLSSFISGPYASMLLAQLGAQVVKVERPPAGDWFRGWGTGTTMPHFHAFNENKRSVCIDWRGNRDWLDGILKASDVLILNFRIDAQRNLGLTYSSLCTLNPGLIVCNICGFGASGAYAALPCYDAVAQAMSGLMSLLTDLENPLCVGPPFGDMISGMFACIGVLAGIQQRQRTGRGQAVDVSMVGSLMGFLSEPIMRASWEGSTPGPLTRSRNSLSLAFVARDGRPFVIHLSSPPRFWEALTQAVGRPELATDDRFKDKQSRIMHCEDLQRELSRCFEGASRDEWLERLRRHGVPCGPLYTIPEALADASLGPLVVTEPDPDGRRFVKIPISFGDAALPPVGPAPELGEGNDEFRAP